MKPKFFRYILPLAFVISLGYLGYRGYGWWQKEQRQRQLFLYFQKDSPLTKRIPPDAALYLSLYDLQRVYTDWKGTAFYDVLAHWLDTGISGKEKANPILGGMLEKTILNVLGNEFVLAVLPGNPPDMIGIARVSAGSDFLLNILLSSAKNVEKTDLAGRLVYAFPMKNSQYEKLYAAVDDPLAYVSTSTKRLQEAMEKEGAGPDFLRDLSIRPIPDDTFVFLQSPKVSALAYGANHRYHFTVDAGSKLEGYPPGMKDAASQVFQLKTNGALLLNQPATSYSLQKIDGLPASGLFLEFRSPEIAKSREATLLAQIQNENGEQSLEHSSKEGVTCFKSVQSDTPHSLCRKGPNLLLAQGNFEIDTADFTARRRKNKHPFILEIELQPDSISEYRQLVSNKDWTRFHQAMPFYFLSCIRSMSGSINGDSDLLTVEIQ